EEAAAVLARMASDDAADLLLELDQERRLPILEAMPSAEQAKLRSLLSHNPSTAGGMMNADFVSVPGEATAGMALGRVREADLG
ncbi:MAG: magnesium transporter MgtE N-terminal domain-containing protein, partial [Solirubrobacteraceae bacterium]